jgi:hypothetical protein
MMGRSTYAASCRLDDELGNREGSGKPHVEEWCGLLAVRGVALLAQVSAHVTVA